MTLLFIDTNILLDFYRQVGPSFQGSIGRATAEEEGVKIRLGLATERFEAVR